MAQIADRLLQAFAPLLIVVALLVWAAAFAWGIVASWWQLRPRQSLPRIAAGGLFAAIAIFAGLFGAQSLVAHGARREIRR
jgi:hypothetical protein